MCQLVYVDSVTGVDRPCSFSVNLVACAVLQWFDSRTLKSPYSYAVSKLDGKNRYMHTDKLSNTGVDLGSPGTCSGII